MEKRGGGLGPEILFCGCEDDVTCWGVVRVELSSSHDKRQRGSSMVFDGIGLWLFDGQQLLQHPSTP